MVKAAKHKSAPLEIQLRSSLRWIDAARCYKPKTLNAAYTLTMELLDKSVAVLCTVSSQHAHLALDELGQRAIRVPSDAAAHSIRQDQLPRAVEYLEHGRAIILRRLMGYRTAMDELKLVDSELADAFVSQSAELEQLVSRDELSTAHAGNGMSREDASEKSVIDLISLILISHSIFTPDIRRFPTRGMLQSTTFDSSTILKHSSALRRSSDWKRLQMKGRL